MCASLVKVMDTRARLWMWLGELRVSVIQADQSVEFIQPENSYQTSYDGDCTAVRWRLCVHIKPTLPIISQYCAKQPSWPSPLYVIHFILEVLFFNWSLQGKVLNVSVMKAGRSDNSKSGRRGQKVSSLWRTVVSTLFSHLILSIQGISRATLIARALACQVYFSQCYDPAVLNHGPPLMLVENEKCLLSLLTVGTWIWRWRWWQYPTFTWFQLVLIHTNVPWWFWLSNLSSPKGHNMEFLFTDTSN